jgi:DNA-binding transcriptional ArsR family regulator
MTKLEEIEDEMRQHSEPVVSVPELAERLDASDTHVRNQLRLLKRTGAVDSKDVGARATAWWHEDRVAPRDVAPADHPDHSDLSGAAAGDDAHSAESEPATLTVDDAVARVDLPGDGEIEDDRRKAMRALLMHLRDAGETTAGELRTLTYEHESTHYAGARSWWKNCASQALSDLEDAGAVELVNQSRGRWRWASNRDE